MNVSSPSTQQIATPEQPASDVLLATIIDAAVDSLCDPNPDMALCLDALIEVANQLRARNGSLTSADTEVAVAAKGVI